ncbi:MAG: stage II sporulation protein D [Pelosinus sp.]|nr:stage II sporulation protein D [Pelosinus sp.]
MKKVLAATAILVLVMVIAIPALVVCSIIQVPSQRETGSRAALETDKDSTIKVYMANTQKIAELKLEEYIKGVVAAEMPAQFELEALKAQAVAARTYAVKHMAVFGGAGLAEHPGADITTDSKEGQAWLSESELKSKWGGSFEANFEKISEAVDGTRGLILTYNGEPIQAVFHSTSGERTASAKEVWGFDYPYLQSVACKFDKASPRYSQDADVSLAQLESKLGSETGVMAAMQSGAGAVQIVDRTSSGRVDKVRIGSKVFTGSEVREKLALKSTNFSIEQQGEKLVFKTIGYGHGVGLCQYGANGMAKEGKDFRQIVTYYYTGVAIKNIAGN